MVNYLEKILEIEKGSVGKIELEKTRINTLSFKVLADKTALLLQRKRINPTTWQSLNYNQAEGLLTNPSYARYFLAGKIFEIWAYKKLPGGQSEYLCADNGGKGFQLKQSEIISINLLYEFAKTGLFKTESEINKYTYGGYTFNKTILNLIKKAKTAISDADRLYMENKGRECSLEAYRALTFISKAKDAILFNIAQHNNSRETPNSALMITTDGTILKFGEKPFRFIGANTIHLAYYDQYGFSVENLIKDAANNGIKVLRIYIDEAEYGSPVLCDRILDSASKNNIYIIITLLDCCNSSIYSSFKEYTDSRPFLDFGDKKSLALFKNYIKRTLLRKNTINGRIYRDDPTILAWDIANEPEYWNYKDKVFIKWARRVFRHIKQLDPNHLITVGLAGYNLDSKFAHALNSKGLDYFSFHYYGKDPGQAAKLTEMLLEFKKPVVLEEFGLASSEKDFLAQPLIRNTTSYSSLVSGIMDAAYESGASGTMFWGWDVPESKNLPLWWWWEGHNINDKNFCLMIKDYIFPQIKNATEP